MKNDRFRKRQSWRTSTWKVCPECKQEFLSTTREICEDCYQIFNNKRQHAKRAGKDV